MNLYNSLTQRIEPFQPQGPEVSVYVCGITPYDTTHLGHAFTYTVFDVLIRFLELQGRKVIYAQNVTDIDDDILRKSRETGENWQELGNRWTAHFIRDLTALNVRPPDYYPGATDFIPQIIAMVERLLQAGVAYEKGGSVYFQVETWPEFGKLSHLPIEGMLPIANERGNNPGDPNKRHPLDFVLWQAQAPGEPAWSSPWGAGRPGWHIECSVMSTSLLGDTIDIHSGGGDLIFPHHECEIAQVEPLTRRPFVRCWMHVAMVHHSGEKMSKSLGNLVMVRDLLQNWSPDVLRLYLGMHHYRDSWSYDEIELAQAGELAERLLEAVTTEGQQPTHTHQPLDPAIYERRFVEALENDLDAPTALSVLAELAADVLSAAQNGQDVSKAQAQMRRLSSVFGLRLDIGQPEPRVIEGWRKHLQRFL